MTDESPDLVDLARRSIASRLEGSPAPTDSGGSEGASFVTLRRDGELRGCIGTLVAHRPLVEDVIENACAAAFRDPRFPPLTPGEMEGLEIHVSVLTEPVDCPVRDEQDLIDRLRPGIDGVILEERGRRATFLPSVWEQIPDPGEFVRQLKRKMGRAPDGWSADMRVSLYEVHEAGGPVL